MPFSVAVAVFGGAVICRKAVRDLHGEGIGLFTFDNRPVRIKGKPVVGEAFRHVGLCPDREHTGFSGPDRDRIIIRRAADAEVVFNRHIEPDLIDAAIAVGHLAEIGGDRGDRRGRQALRGLAVKDDHIRVLASLDRLKRTPLEAHVLRVVRLDPERKLGGFPVGNVNECFAHRCEDHVIVHTDIDRKRIVTAVAVGRHDQVLCLLRDRVRRQRERGRAFDDPDVIIYLPVEFIDCRDDFIPLEGHAVPVVRLDRSGDDRRRVIVGQDHTAARSRQAENHVVFYLNSKFGRTLIVIAVPDDALEDPTPGNVLDRQAGACLTGQLAPTVPAALRIPAVPLIAYPLQIVRRDLDFQLRRAAVRNDLQILVVDGHGGEVVVHHSGQSHALRHMVSDIVRQEEVIRFARGQLVGIALIVCPELFELSVVDEEAEARIEGVLSGLVGGILEAGARAVIVQRHVNGLTQNQGFDLHLTKVGAEDEGNRLVIAVAVIDSAADISVADGVLQIHRKLVGIAFREERLSAPCRICDHPFIGQFAVQRRIGDRSFHVQRDALARE